MTVQFFVRKTPDGPEIEVQGTAKVGRLATNEIVLRESSYASRHHATLSVAGDVLSVEDAGSSNGTYVNGQRIRAKTRLQDKDRLRFDVEEYVVRGPPVAANAQQTVFRDAAEAKTGVRSQAVVPPPSVVPPPVAVAVAPANPVPSPASSSPAQPRDARVQLKSAAIARGSPAPPPPAGLDRVAAIKQQPASAQAAQPGRPPADPASVKEPPASLSKSDAPPRPVIENAAPQPGAARRRPGAWIERPSDSGGDDGKTKFIIRRASRNTGSSRRHRQAPDDVDVPTLFVLSGKRAGDRIELNSQGDSHEWLVGSDAALAVALTDDGVSHLHAALERNGSRWVVCDKLATNGLFVNGIPTTRRMLASNDRIDFGPVQTRLVLPRASFGVDGERRFRLGRAQGWFAVFAFVATLGILVLLKVYWK